MPLTLGARSGADSNGLLAGNSIRPRQIPGVGGAFNENLLNANFSLVINNFNGYQS
jgi:hypothetical protein